MIDGGAVSCTNNQLSCCLNYNIPCSLLHTYIKSLTYTHSVTESIDSTKVQYTVTCHLYTHFLGTYCQYGTHFLAEKRSVQNDIFCFGIINTNFKVMIQSDYT